jgi:hypothetical protein
MKLSRQRATDVLSYGTSCTTEAQDFACRCVAPFIFLFIVYRVFFLHERRAAAHAGHGQACTSSSTSWFGHLSGHRCQHARGLESITKTMCAQSGLISDIQLTV